MGLLLLGVARPERAVLLYWGGNLACFRAASLNSTNLLVRCPLCTIVGSGAPRDSLFRQAAEALRGPTRWTMRSRLGSDSRWSCKWRSATLRCRGAEGS